MRRTSLYTTSPTNIILLAPHDYEPSEPWFSPGRQAKLNSLITIFNRFSAQITWINTAPSSMPESKNLVQLIGPTISRLSLFLSIYRLYSYSRQLCQLSHTSTLWVYNTRFRELLYTLILIFNCSIRNVVLQIEDLPCARIENAGLIGFLDTLATRIFLRIASSYTYVSPLIPSILHDQFNLIPSASLYFPPLLSSSYVSLIPSRSKPFNSETIHIVYSGAYEYDKGVDIIIDAFLSLPSEKYQLSLMGPAPESLRRRFIDNPRIIFTGYLEAKAYYEHYLTADVIVNPHRPLLHSDYIFPHKLLDMFVSQSLPLTTPSPALHFFDFPDVCIFSTSSELASQIVSAQTIHKSCTPQLLKLSKKIMDIATVDDLMLSSFSSLIGS